MKVKLKELKPNPFKKYINGGVLNPQKIDLLKESIKQDGFWDNVICRKNGNGYEIAYGHHRLEAAKQVLGGNHEIDIPVKELTDEMMVRILGNENCMQNEEYAIYQVDQVLLAKKWLEGSATDNVQLRQGKRTDLGDKHINAEQISKFLGEKNWSPTKVKEYLRISEKLNPKILHEMKNVPNSGGEDVDELTVSHASRIARLPQDKQVEVAKLIKKDGLNTRETENLVNTILGNTNIREEKRRVDKTRINNVIKDLEGQEIALTCKSLLSLLKRNKLRNFEVKEQLFLKEVYKTLLTELQNQVGGEK